MGSSVIFLRVPTPHGRCLRDSAHDGLPARMHMDVLDGDFLLAAASQRFPSASTCATKVRWSFVAGLLHVSM
jgi:hypothetical protein